MDLNESITALRNTLTEQAGVLKLFSISDVVRRDCALVILQWITDFLESSWPEGRKKGFPDGIIREGFALVLSELGPGDTHLRTVLLDMLRKTSNGRQQLLDVLPYAMPLDGDQRESATNMILEVFRDILFKDSSSLLPILGSLSTLSLSEQGRHEAWKLALVSLPALELDDLPVAVQSLLRNVTTPNEARLALDGIRNNVDDITLIGNLVLGAMQQNDDGRLLCDAYMDLLENIATEESAAGFQRSDTCAFVLLDVIVLLDLYQRPDFKVMIESLMDGMLQLGTFPFADFRELLSILRPRDRSIIQERIPLALQELGLFLLLAPVRLQSIDTTLISSRTHALVMDLHSHLDRIRQEELVRSLLHLGDELASIQPSKRMRRRGSALQRQRIEATCQAVHGLVLALANSDPSSITRFKFLLIERLTSEKRRSNYPQVCSILVRLLDGGLGSGVDSTELMILLQKLLFSSSLLKSQRNQHDNVDKVSRGLVLANFLVQSTAMADNDKDCIHQWVLKILLPSNRRTVEPRVGSTGLEFLATWSKQPKGNQSIVFEHVKMIMANTGLVQLKEVYLQRKRTDIDLAYTEIPTCFISATSDEAKKKRRDLLFCVNTFLQFRGLPSPPEWTAEASWVFTLVDTYLQQGRADSRDMKRSKWLPNGWLEASLEIPAFPFPEDGKPDEDLVAALKNYALGKGSSRPRQLEDRLRTLLLANDNFLARRKQTENVLRLVLAMLLSIGLSIAVLRNSHDHVVRVDRQGGKETNGREGDVLNLLKYQLLKIYDLQGRLKILLSMIDSFGVAMRKTCKLGNTESELDSQRKQLEEAGFHGRAVLSSFLTMPSFLDVELLKTCFINESDNTLLLQQEAPMNGTQSRLEMLLLLRLHILEHSVSSYYTHKVTSMFTPEVAHHCSSIVASLMPMTKHDPVIPTKQGPQRLSDTTSLLSSYLEYVICALDHVLRGQVSPNDGVMMLKSLINCKTCTYEDQKSLASDLFDQFLRYTKQRTDAVLALQCAEIIALVAQLDPARLLKDALNVGWRVMHTIYPSKPTVLKTGASPSFEIISTHLLEGRSGNHQRNKVLRASIVKCSTSKRKDFKTASATRRSLLLLWSMLVQPLAAAGQETVILSSIVDDIDTFFRGSVEEKVVRGNKVKAAKKSSRSVALPKIPSLNGATILVYVEMTIHLIISTFSVIEPARCIENRNPFLHLVDFPKLLGRLTALVQQHFAVFPRRFVSLLATSCHHLLDLSISKTRECVDWRNSQPLLTTIERKAGKFDYASVRLLEQFLQEMSISSCGSVASFCSRARNSGEELFEGQTRKLKALRLDADRAANTLKSIALTHNLVPTKDPFDMKEQTEFVCSTKARVKGFHADDESSELMDAKRKRQRVIPVPVMDVEKGETGNVDGARPEGGEYEWHDDDDDGKSSHSFGVLGDWGSTGSGPSSDESSNSLELEPGALATFQIPR